MDFNPNIDDNDTNNVPQNNTLENAPKAYEPTSIVIESSKQNKELLSMGGLLGLTKSHIEGSLKCGQDIERLSNAIDSIQHLLSPKELIEYLKVKLHQQEFHTECVFKAYSIMQKTDMAKEMMASSERKERIIEATDRTKINYLLGKLNPNRTEELE